MYLEKIRKLQREMMSLQDWRSKNIKENISSMKDYDKKFRDMETQIQKQECHHDAFAMTNILLSTTESVVLRHYD